MSAALLLVWSLEAVPALVEVRSEQVEGRPAIVLVASAPVGGVGVRREGPEVIVALAATAPASLAAPAVSAPIESLRIERTPLGVQVRIRVAPAVAYDLRREVDRVTLLFGAGTAQAVPASSADLYRALFPSSEASEPGDLRAAGGEGAPGGVPPVPSPEEKASGLSLGSLTIRPAATLAYVDADVSLLDTPVPVRDQYAEARPSVGIEIPLGNGQMRLGYEARIRRFSSFSQVNQPAHEANGSLEYPMGPFLTLRGQGHFARGVLEASQVDPGGEYFFQLGRFTRWVYGGGLRFNPEGRLGVDVGGTVDRVNVEEGAAFFDYERRNVSGALVLEIGASRRARFAYSLEQVPASPERPESESRVHSVLVAVDGEIMPLLSGRVSAGYTLRDSPLAAPEGRRFRGLTFGADLKRDFGRSANIILAANRSTELSAFEQNAFYVTTSANVSVTAPLPWSLSLTAGGGYHVNSYPTVANGLDVRRRDEIVDWLAGLGRSITRWAFVRADYRHDRRDSNLDFFDQRTHALYVQLGLGFFGSARR
ncbi:MAG TPA: outer membrane beta-barrel protein [Vicinamibacteria bacterium]